MKQEDATPFVTVGNTGSCQPQLQQPTKNHILQDQYITGLENCLRALWDKYYVDQKHYTDRIKRLEEAGDTMANAYRQICYDAYDDQQVDNWFKAKEAKP